MQQFITRPVMFTVLLGLSGLVGAPAIHAQVQNQSPPIGKATPSAKEAMQQAQSQPRKDVSDKDLQAFAKAYVEVQKIKNSQQGSLNNAPDPQQSQKIQQDTSAEMAKAVQKQGFTPETYAQMLATINGDTTLNQKAMALVKKERAS